MRKLIKNVSRYTYEAEVLSKYPVLAREQLSCSSDVPTTLLPLGNSSIKGIILNVENILCPYCDFKEINKSVGEATNIDHFKSKEDFAHLSLTFSNLIPSCSRCNTVKGRKTLSINPYSDRVPNTRFVFSVDSAKNVTGIFKTSKSNKYTQMYIDLNFHRLFNDANVINQFNAVIEDVKELRRVVGSIDLKKLPISPQFKKMVVDYDDSIGI